MTLDAASVPFNAGALTGPVDPTAAREFGRRLRDSGRVTGLLGSASVAGVVIVVTFLLVMGGSLVLVFGSVFAALVTRGAGGGWGAVLGVLVPVFVMAAIVALVIFVFVAARRSQEARWYRLDRFARENGMTYLPSNGQPALPGMIFGIGSARQALDCVRGEKPRFVEFANYRYTTGSGKNRTTHRWGYVAVKLDVPLPNIVLDAKGNDSIFGSNLPASFDRDQRLSLEGDFDQYFSLYCPEGYERDALYLFTPDIMARFIDNAAALDVEIVDDWLFLYAKRDFSTLDAATWGWLFSVVGALLDKLAQWARWRDERLASQSSLSTADAEAGGSAPIPGQSPVAAPGAVPFAAPATLLRPPPGVAPQGRRLTRRVSWVTIVATVAIVAWWILSQTGLLARLLSGLS